MKKIKKKLSGREKKRLKFIRETRSRRNETKHKYDINYSGKFSTAIENSGNRFKDQKSKK